MTILLGGSALVSPFTMTVCADDVALGHFSKDRFRAGSSDHLADEVLLFMRVTMVELHHEVWKGLTAIEARHRTQLREEPSLCPSSRSSSLEVSREARRSMAKTFSDFTHL